MPYRCLCSRLLFGYITLNNRFPLAYLISVLKAEAASTLLFIVRSVSSTGKMNNKYLSWEQHYQHSLDLSLFSCCFYSLSKSLETFHPLQALSHHSYNPLAYSVEDLRLPYVSSLRSLPFPLWQQFSPLSENEVFHLLFMEHSFLISLSPFHSYLFQDSRHISISILKIFIDSFP